MAILDWEHWARETNLALPGWFSVTGSGSVSADGAGPFGIGRYVSGAGTTCGRYLSFANTAETFTNFWVFFAGLADTVIYSLMDNTTAQVSIRITLTGTLRVVRGTSTLLGETAAPVALNTWLFVQLRTVVNNTTGIIELRVNGVPVITLTGQNTRSSANNFANGWTVGGTNTRIAHLLIHSTAGDAPVTWTPETFCYADLPTGAGFHSGFTPSAGANWQNTDDQPNDGDTTYNAAAAPAKDSYAVSGSTPAGAVVYGVAVEAVARKDDAGVNTLDLGLRVSGTDYMGGAAAPLTTNYQRFRRLWTVNPAGGAWTVSAANAAEPVAERVA